ncbi:MAG: type IV toxin-antitoxin system AbiEi family antitoxin domain-containing protein [Aeromicrobium sp.]
MDELLMHRAETRGFITRPEILDSGYGDREIRDAIVLGLLTRVGAGLYALSATYAPLSVEAKLVTRSRAVSHRHRGAVVLTHQSAAAMHGMSMWGTSLDEVHVTRLDGGRGRHESGVQHHVGTIGHDEVVEIDGALVSNPARCVWELACASSVESGIVTADSALHQQLVTPESLTETAGQFRTWRGSRSGRLALSLADERAESPGESRSRYLFWRHDVPKPELQFTVYDVDGHVLARTDFAWELYRHLAEFDGRIKYDGTFTPQGFESVFVEKRREDIARGELWGMSRLIWSDLPADVAARTARRLKADLERSRSLYARHIS